MEHKNCKVDEFQLPLEIERGGQGRAIQPHVVKPTECTTLIESLMCEERGIFHNKVDHFGLRSGFLQYGLKTPVCSMSRVPHFTTWGTQPFGYVGRAPQSLVRVLCVLFSRLLRQAYSFDTVTCTGRHEYKGTLKSIQFRQAFELSKESMFNFKECTMNSKTDLRKSFG